MPVKLTPRLATALPYVRPGHVVADIGTDHAYLPIHLCESGILPPRADGSTAAIAADINRGPVERATAHIAAAGLSDRIRTVQTDGLSGLHTYTPTDIIIFGMGGELITAILAAAPWVRDPGIRLILQPMTHAEKLRAYLHESGFSIVGETLSREGERIYQTICAAWTATPAHTPLSPEADAGPAYTPLSPEADAGPAYTPLSPAELAVGQARHRTEETQRALAVALIDKTIRTESAARAARAAAGQDISDADALLASLARLRETLL